MIENQYKNGPTKSETFSDIKEVNKKESFHFKEFGGKIEIELVMNSK